MKLIRCTLAAAVVAAFAAPMVASAATGTAQGATPLSANANLNFSVVIPQFIMIRVGAAAGVSTFAYAPTVADMTTPTAVNPTGGDASPDEVTYRFLGNAGNLQLGASALANLTSGANSISSSTLSGSFVTGTLNPPAFGATVALAAGGGGIVNQSGTWRYTWTNQANTVYPAGTYTGTVTYTLSAP